MNRHDISITEGSRAIAQAVALCRPQVIAAYPITPQTHIVEDLAKFCAQGKLLAQYVRAESETAAASIVLGASASGVKAYTATSSQGLLHMMEVIYNLSGLRLPAVMTLANRAISGPINIWNDHSDAMAMRDAGWIMLFAESAQEAVDMHIIAFKLSEKLNIPVAVNVDGFLITHTSEPVILPKQPVIDKFLNTKTDRPHLDTNNPLSFGLLHGPTEYQNERLKLHQDLNNSSTLIDKTFAEYYKLHNTAGLSNYNKNNNGLYEWYGPNKANRVIIVMGSLAGTFKDALDASGDKNTAILRLKCFRPLPIIQLTKILKGKQVAVVDRAVSLGAGGPLSLEIKSLLAAKQVNSIIGALGGKNFSNSDFTKIIKQIGKTKEIYL